VPTQSPDLAARLRRNIADPPDQRADIALALALLLLLIGALLVIEMEGGTGPSSPRKRHGEYSPFELCVQRRLACSAGGKPAGARVRSPVVRIAGWRETKILKPIDAVSLGEITSHRAVTTVNVDVASKMSGSEGRARNCRVKAAWGAEI